LILLFNSAFFFSFSSLFCFYLSSSSKDTADCFLRYLSSNTSWLLFILFLGFGWSSLLFYSASLLWPSSFSSWSSAKDSKLVFFFPLFFSFIFFSFIYFSFYSSYFFYTIYFCSFVASLTKISSKGLITTYVDNILGGLTGLSSPSVSLLYISNKLNIVSPTTLPKIVCLLSSHEHLSKVIKN